MTRDGESRIMQVFLNGQPAGVLQLSDSAALSFTYHHDWLLSKHAIPISLSLPLREKPHQGVAVMTCLENLLPDNQEIRKHIATLVCAKGTDAWHMLEKIGRDCVGALQFVSGENSDIPEIGRLEGEPVSEAQIANILRNLANAPLGLNEKNDFRICIAGAQEKTALLRYENTWIRPSGFTPTTHILKTQLGVLPAGINLSDSVENEYFCMKFCHAMGMNVADVRITDFEDMRSLIITRFDRHWTRDGKLLRLPQEDFCQALAIPTDQKYQMDGGPGITEGTGLLAGSDDSEKEQSAFFRAQLLFWLLGATDGHAKNFSIALRSDGFHMTPLYDVLSAQKAVDDGQITKNRMRLAMKVAGHYRINEIVPRHFPRAAKTAGFDITLAENILSDIAAKIEPALDRVFADLPDDFPMPVAEIITAGIRSRATSFISHDPENIISPFD